ncbi:MAG: hypothetical protein R6X02_16780 [Enhygromyxa sp.]
MADFDPRQLDSLEDALEGLEEIDDLESLELSPALTERLAEYQDVLALCREAFPVEEPRAELLTDLLAEAHAVSRRVKPSETDESTWRRFWTRWRGTLIPGLALAGTAALVLLALEPEPAPKHAQRASDEQRSEQARDPAEGADSTPSEPTNLPQTDQADEPDEPDEPDPKQADGAEPIPFEPIDTTGPAPVNPVKKSKPRTSKSAAIADPPKPAPEPLSKDETWTSLERANADRRRGDCDRARSRYERVLAASADKLAISRAKAGIGLCLEQDRRKGEADRWFEQARATNAGIDAWIAEQRDEQPLPGETKKSKAKKSASDHSL